MGREEIVIFKENNIFKNINFVTAQIIINKTLQRNIIYIKNILQIEQKVYIINEKING